METSQSRNYCTKSIWKIDVCHDRPVTSNSIEDTTRWRWSLLKSLIIMSPSTRGTAWWQVEMWPRHQFKFPGDSRGREGRTREWARDEQWGCKIQITCVRCPLRKILDKSWRIYLCLEVRQLEKTRQIIVKWKLKIMQWNTVVWSCVKDEWPS